MICDRIEYADCYRALGGRFATLFRYLGENDLATFEPGEYVIDGDELFMSIKEYSPREPSAANWETHRNYIDMQFLLRGHERMGIKCAANLPVRVPYDAALDRTFYSHDIAADYYLPLTGGMFVFLFPHDAHLASLADGEAGWNKKAIIKIRV